MKSKQSTRILLLLTSPTYLQDNITLSDETLLNNLFQENVLDSLEVVEIRSKTTDHDMIALLLQFILRITKEQFEKFLEVLNK